MGLKLDRDRLAELRDAHGVVRYRYDEYGNVASIDRSASETIRYSHDAAGQLSEVECANGLHIERDYSDNGSEVAVVADRRRRVRGSHDGAGHVTAYAWEQLLS